MPAAAGSSRSALEPARTLFDYLRMDAPLAPAQAIIVFGGHDLRVAQWGARLWLDGWAPRLVITGGLGYYTRRIWQEAEALKFRQVALDSGVAASAILIEDQSTNTGENVRLTRALLAQRCIPLARAIAVQKPYRERRTHLTLKKQWAGCEFHLSSPPIAFDDYPHPDIIDVERLLHELVGQVDRIEKYPALGFTVHTDVPPAVLRAKQQLIELGFGRQLLAPASAPG